jgi:signal transduction histidine kinase
VLDVIDDGRGFGAPARVSGVVNLHRRAARHHGELKFSTPSGGGTHLSWNVDVSASAPSPRGSNDASFP